MESFSPDATQITDDIIRNIDNIDKEKLHIIQTEYKQYHLSLSFMHKGINNLRISNDPWRHEKNFEGLSLLKSYIKNIVLFINYLNQIFNDIFWLINSRGVLNNFKKNGQHFDIIITTSPVLGTLFIGNQLKRNNSNAKWMADFRDSPFLPSIMNKLILSLNKKLLNHYVKKISLITVVSQGIKESILDNCFGNYKKSKIPKIKVVYNGFDKEDRIKKSALIFNQSKKLNICYMGTLYSGRRDPTILFDVIRDLINKNLAETSDFQINYAGTEPQVLINIAKKFDLEKIIINHGLLSFNKSLLIQSSADFILVLTWNTKSEHGIITGKFPEALLSGKPIIGIVSGDEANSELEYLIKKYSLGYFGNYVNYQTNKSKLEYFIINAVTNKKLNRKSEGLTNINKVNQLFDYEYICKTILNELN